ncbi:MAG: iron ABC transporter permease [Epulopiscium sp. Nele67-Bin004]|nr:MAG: iron ABC transporter permease [Epulopiscium sp. Nele67-Bin004]
MVTKIADYYKKIGILGVVVRISLMWFVLALLIIPNVNLFIKVFFSDGEFSTTVVTKVLNSNRAMKALWNSVVLAFSMIISINVLGVLVVLFTEYFDLKGAKILKLGYMTSLIYGGIVFVTAYQFVYGNQGIVTNFLVQIFPEMNTGWFIGYPAVLFIMTFACTSNHIIFLTNAIRSIDNQVIEAAQILGEKSGKIFTKVVLPILTPTLFAITILTFLTGLGAVSAPLIVGGSDFQTINPIIIEFSKTSFSREIAAFLAMLLGLATTVLLVIMNKIEKGGTYMSIAKTKTSFKKQKIRSPFFNVLAHIVAWGLWLIYVTPVVLVTLYSFMDYRAIRNADLSLSNFTLENWQKLFSQQSAFEPFVVSIVYSGLASILVVILILFATRIIQKATNKFERSLEYVLLLPWLLPSTLIAIGLMMTYDTPRPIMANKVLIGTQVILLFAYIIIKLPFTLRMVKAAFFSIDDSLEEAAQTMGASPFYILRRVIVPIIFPTLVSVMVLNFNSLLSDYDVTVFLYHPLLQPLGIVIKNATDADSSLDAVAMTFVYSVCLMIISAVALYFTQGDGANLFKKKSK